MNYTHKGWMLFCPIYLSPNDPEFPVEARHLCLEALLTLATWLQRLAILALSAMNPDYEPRWMFRITGKIDQ